MQIVVTEKYIALERGERNERFSVNYLRKVNERTIKRRKFNQSYRAWEIKLKFAIIFSIGAFVAGWIFQIASGLGLLPILLFTASIAALIFWLAFRIFFKPEKFIKYDLHLAEFVSGENEIFGITSLNKEITEDFANKISEAMRGDLSGVYNFSIDQSINAESANIENLSNSGEGTVNFYEGADTSQELRNEEEK